MNAQEAWQAAKNQLENQMPRTTFNTWVRDVTLLEHTDAGFRLGVKNADARDWLDSRLTTMLTNLLRGFLNTNGDFSVEFAVDEGLTEENSGKGGEEDTAEQIGVLSSATLLEAILQPHRALYTPRYLLRWLPYIGAKPFWVLLAFRQAFYLCADRKPEPAGDRTYISQALITDLTGVDSKTLKNYFDRGQLEWFLTQVPNNDYRKIDGTIKKVAFEYIFHESTPLTPQDQETLLDWLLGQGFANDPARALAAAEQTRLSEILPRFPKPPTRSQKNARPHEANRTLSALIMTRLPAGLSDADRMTCLKLTESLQLQLRENFGDLRISHFFFKNWLPLLSHTAAAAIIWLRSLGFWSSVTGELRDEVFVPGGLKTIAQALGISTQTLQTWFPRIADYESHGRKVGAAKQEQQQKRERLRASLEPFIPLVRLENRDFADLRIKIALADPLPHDWQAEYEFVLDLATRFLSRGSNAELPELGARFISAIEHSGLIGADAVENMTNSANGYMTNSLNDLMTDSANGDMTNSAIGDMTDSRDQASDVMTISAIADYDKFRQFKDSSLRRVQKTEIHRFIRHLTNTPEQDQQIPRKKGAVSHKLIWEVTDSSWNQSILMTRLNFSPQEKQSITDKGVLGSTLAAYILYAYSPAGQSIRSPRHWISKMVLGAPGEAGAGHYNDWPYDPAYFEMARLRPAQIAQLIQQTEIANGRLSLQAADLPGASLWSLIYRELEDVGSLEKMAEKLGLTKTRKLLK
jgi:hypothetical protein